MQRKRGLSRVESWFYSIKNVCERFARPLGEAYTARVTEAQIKMAASGETRVSFPYARHARAKQGLASVICFLLARDTFYILLYALAEPAII